MPDPQAASGVQQFFIRVRGRVLGPFTLEKLKTLRARGQFSRVHEFSTDREIWQPASALEGMFEASLPSSKLPDPHGSGPARTPGAPPSLPQIGSRSGPSMPGALWYYNVAGELYGPVSIFDLRGMISAANLRLDDYVWKEGMPNWLPISQVPELKSPAEGSSSAARAPAAQTEGPARRAPERTSGMAVTSLVLGIFAALFPIVGLVLGLLVLRVFAILSPIVGLVLGLLAVIFGALALRSISGAQGALGGRGMATSGMVLGILSLAVWSFALLGLVGVIAAPGLPAIWRN